MQLRNFCLNKTTSERFGRQKVVQESRTSTYLESESASMDESELSMSIVEVMQTRDHSSRSCTTMLNCKDMCCGSQHPDQDRIYNSKKKKSEKEEKEDPNNITLTLGSPDNLSSDQGKRYR